MKTYEILYVCTILFYNHCLGHWLLPFWPEETTTCVPSETFKQENFNVTRFLGRWYETHYNSNNKLFADGVVIDFFINKSLKAVIKQEDGSSEFITSQQLIYSNGQFILYENGNEDQIDDKSQAPITLVETDYVNYAILYSCFQPMTSSKCEGEFQFLSVLSRSPHLGKTLRSYIANLVETKLCINLDDIMVSRKNIQNQPEVEALVESSSCRVSEMEHQKNFSFKKFLGIWFNLAQSPPLTGAVCRYYMTDKKSFSITFFGNIKGQCIPPFLVRGAVIDDHISEFKIHYKFLNIVNSGQMRILYTDYEDSAIVYVCYKEDEDGTCAKESTYIDFLSRSPTWIKGTRQKLNSIASHFCIQPEEVIDANYSVNCFPSSIVKMLKEKQVAKYTTEEMNGSKTKVPVRFIEKDDRIVTKNLKASLYMKKDSQSVNTKIEAIGIVPKLKINPLDDPDKMFIDVATKDIDEIEDKVLFDNNANSQKKNNRKESDSIDDDNSEEKQLQGSQVVENDEETTTAKSDRFTTHKYKKQKDESGEDESGSSEDKSDKPIKKIKLKNKEEEDDKVKSNKKENKKIKNIKESNEDESNENKENSEDDKIKRDKSDENTSNEDEIIKNKDDNNENDKMTMKKDESNEDEDKNLRKKNGSIEDKSNEYKSNEDTSNEDEKEKLKNKDDSKKEVKKIKKKNESNENEDKKVRKKESNKQIKKKYDSYEDEKLIIEDDYNENNNLKKADESNENSEEDKKQSKKERKKLKKNTSWKNRSWKESYQRNKAQKGVKENKEDETYSWNNDWFTDWSLVRDQQASIIHQLDRHCLDHFLLATKLQQKYPSWTVFIPKCEATGQYQPIQCNSNNECWCVNSGGITISGTRKHVTKVENVAVNCDDRNKV